MKDVLGRERPVTEPVLADCEAIRSHLAAGFSPQRIRTLLNLTKRQYDYRMKVLSHNAQDAHEVWTKFIARTDVRYTQLEQIRQEAMKGKPKLDVARRAICDMARIDREQIEVGQALGRYKKVAERVDVTVRNPTLGMLWDTDIEDEAPIVESKEPIVLRSDEPVRLTQTDRAEDDTVH
jgi:hypothetical protein